MPKQIYKIVQFHGGMNSNSDYFDIADNELGDATDVMVDEIGKIRNMGGTAAHDAGSSPTVDIESGYGLFHFAHDRINGHLGEHLDEGDFASHANWDDNTDWDDSPANTTTYTHSSGNGYIEQIANDRLEAGIPSITYAFTCTISGLDSDSEITNLTSLYIKGGSGYFAASDTNITKANGTHTVTFTSHSSAHTGVFRLYAASSGTTVWSMDDVSLVIAEAAETGDDYLLLGDNESSDPAVYIYSKNKDAWSESQTITLGTTTGMKPAFYAVDGAVRISDGSFGELNTNQWYGYIKRTLFPDVLAIDIDQWYNTAQKISPPNTSYFDDNAAITAEETSIGDHTISGSSSADDVSATRATIDAGLDADADDAIVKAEVNWVFEVALTEDTKAVSLVLTVGTYYDGSFVTSDTAVVADGDTEGGLYSGTSTLYFDPDTTNVDNSWGGTPSEDSFRAEFTSNAGAHLSTWGITSMVLYDAGTVGLANFSSILSSNNTVLEFDWEANTGASGWQNATDTGKWEVGVSFIYDGIQESQITMCVDKDATSTTALSPQSGVTEAPVIRMYIEGFIFNGWNKRITGCNVYMRDISQDSLSPWFLQLSGDFVTGKMIVGSTQQEFDISYNSTREVYFWEISNAGGADITANLSAMLVPADIISYEDNSGIDPNEKSITSKYKTAVVTNRTAYIGNIEVQYESSKEVMGDTMLKSPVNKFDLFPLARRIEASVRDGDEIVKLEEYADRILQFKKNKMHLINVSQEVEILEDTFMHKGVSHPAATCKTDFGVAWVNNLGCYLYDGKNVINLLEKKGRQIIKESDWANFTAYEPMISYIPKKRQLLIVDDNSTTGGGNIFLYDLVTQSWVKGSGTITSNNLTNFITDWNGDLVVAHTNGTVRKWSDTSEGQTGWNIVTKYIDFGQPSQKKKVYKVYINYKCTGSSAPLIRFDVDGDTGIDKTFNETFGTSANNWTTATFTPSDPTQTNGIYSFILRIYSTGTTHSSFEINDISIVFRAKPIK